MMMAEPKMNYNEETVRRVQAQLQDNNSMRALSAFFKVIGDETRVKIICALSVQELCVNELAAVLGMTQSAVSHLARTGMARSTKGCCNGDSPFIAAALLRISIDKYI